MKNYLEDMYSFIRVKREAPPPSSRRSLFFPSIFCAQLKAAVFVLIGKFDVFLKILFYETVVRVHTLIFKIVSSLIKQYS